MSESLSGILSELGITAQLVKVEEITSKFRWHIISKAQHLKDNTDYRKTYINRDITLEQRRLNAQLREKLKDSDPNGKYEIYRGRVVKQD